MKLRLLLSFLLLLFFVVSCSDTGNETDKPNWKDPEPKQPASQTVDSAQFGELLGDSSRISLPAEHNQLCELLFGEAFSRDRMDQMEKVPIFRNSRKSVFRKYLKKEYIANDYGNKIFPRPVLKGWEFESEEQARLTLTDWLNQQDSSDPDEIELGEDVDAVKSPPMMVAQKEQRIFMLNSACVYSGESWEKLKSDFATYFQEKDASVLFEISCQAGKLTNLP